APDTTDPKAVSVKLYDDDPAHLWNRLHAALFVRIGGDGKSYGEDEVDPLIWPYSRFLLDGPRHRHVLTLLDEFLTKDGDKLIRDPLKRAVLQRDLWAVFDWLADPYTSPREESDEVTARRRALQVRLAKIIRRLALSAEEIGKLPDNHAAAVT